MYGLAITLEGRQLPGSPFQIRIRNDETVAANCKLYGGGLTRGEAGARNAFFIQGTARMMAAKLARLLTGVMNNERCALLSNCIPQTK